MFINNVGLGSSNYGDIFNDWLMMHGLLKPPNRNSEMQVTEGKSRMKIQCMNTQLNEL